MTVSENSRRKEYAGDGVTVLFNGPMAYEARDIVVYLFNSAGDGAIVPTSQYQVNNLGRAAGTRITMNNAPQPDEELVILRTVRFAQLVDISNQSNFNANVLERSDDLLAMQIQQLADGSMVIVFDPDEGEFVWDAKGVRIIRVGDAVALQDAMNMRSTLEMVEQIQAGGGSVGVTPKFWSWEGDDESIDFPIPGADVDSNLFYDTAMEVSPGVYTVLRPGEDFEVLIDSNTDDSVIRLATAPAAGVKGFTTLRGYARPFIGPEPITTVAPEIVVIDGSDPADLLIDARRHNTMIVVNSATPVTLTIRENTGDADLDWGKGEFFSVLQFGAGQVTLAPEGAGTVTPPADFENKTRAVGSIISASCVAEDSDLWASSGDLLRTAVTPTRQAFRLIDRSVLIATNATTGTTKDSFIMPYGLQLDAIADRGCYAGLAVAQAAGSVFTVDVNVNGTSILSTKLTFDNNEKTTLTAATPAVFDAAFVAANRIIPAGAEVTIDIDQVGTALAKGLGVYLCGVRSN